MIATSLCHDHCWACGLTYITSSRASTPSGQNCILYPLIKNELLLILSVQASVNTLAWAPHSSCHICTAGDDCQALIWDLSSMSQPLDGGLDPILAYHAGAEINNLQWSSAQPDWVAIAFNNNVQVLRV